MVSKKKTISPAWEARSAWTYEDAIAWIADNDNAGDDAALDVDAVHGYITVGFVSDLFHVDQRVVATDVVGKRAANAAFKAMDGEH